MASADTIASVASTHVDGRAFCCFTHLRVKAMKMQINKQLKDIDFLAILLVLIAMITAVPANGAERSTKANLLMEAAIKDLNIKINLDGFVRAADQYCKEIDSIFPRNSPSEEKWLSDELSGKGERVTLAIKSVEFYKRSIESFSEKCRTYTDIFSMKGRNYRIYSLIGLGKTFLDIYNRYGSGQIGKILGKEEEKYMLELSFIIGDNFIEAAMAEADQTQ